MTDLPDVLRRMIDDARNEGGLRGVSTAGLAGAIAEILQPWDGAQNTDGPDTLASALAGLDLLSAAVPGDAALAAAGESMRSDAATTALVLGQVRLARDLLAAVRERRILKAMPVDDFQISPERWAMVDAPVERGLVSRAGDGENARVGVTAAGSALVREALDRGGSPTEAIATRLASLLAAIGASANPEASRDLFAEAVADLGDDHGTVGIARNPVGGIRDVAFNHGNSYFGTDDMVVRIAFGDGATFVATWEEPTQRCEVDGRESLRRFVHALVSDLRELDFRYADCHPGGEGR